MATIRTPYTMLREWLEKTKRRQTIYAFFVLACLTVIYLANQMDRFLLGVVSKRLSRDLVFGSKGCLPTGISGSRVNDTCASHLCHAIHNETRSVYNPSATTGLIISQFVILDNGTV